MPTFNKPTSLNEVWASNGAITAPVNLKVSQGWTVEIPPYQYFNWSQNRVDSFMAHVNQVGIPVWDSVTEYLGNKSHVQGSDGRIYKALSTNTNVDPAVSLNRATWEVAFESFGSVAVVQKQLDTLQANYNTLAGVTNYPQARQNLSVWSRGESDTRYAYKAGAGSQTFAVANATDNAHAIPLGQLNSLLQQATTTIVGTMRIGTTTEVEQGTLDNVAVTPLTGAATYLKKSQNLADVSNKITARTNLGITDVATRSESYFVRNLDLVAQIATYARATAPAGWLVCDGRAVSRTTYKDLFDAIGTLYGAGDGTTTFNLPDCRDEFMRGWNGTTASVGAKTAQSVQSHTHSASSSSDGAHSHTTDVGSSGHHSHGATADAGGAHVHSVTDSKWTPTVGPDTIGDSREPRKLTDFGAADTYGNYNTSSAGHHSHNVSVGGAGSHQHSVLIGSGGAHTHAVTVAATGGTETAPKHIRFLICIRH